MKEALGKTVESVEVVKYDVDMAIVATLDKKYADIKEITNKTDLDMVTGGQREYREMRLAVDEWHKREKAPWQRKAKAYDAEKNRVRALLEPGETHLKIIRDSYKKELLAIETGRIKNIQNRIGDIKANNMGLGKMTSAQLKNLYDRIKNTSILEEDYQEFLGEATAAVHNTLIDIDVAFKNREYDEGQERKRKEEDERLKKERERLAAIEKENEDRERIRRENAQKEQKKIDAENARIKAEQAVAQKKIEALEDQRKAEQDAAQKKVDNASAEVTRREQELKAKEQAAEQKEREKIIAKEATERAKQEAEAKSEQNRLDAIAKEEADKEEADRREALKPDKEKLISWINYTFKYDIKHTMPLKSKEAKDIYALLLINLDTFVKDALEKINKL